MQKDPFVLRTLIHTGGWDFIVYLMDGACLFDGQLESCICVFFAGTLLQCLRGKGLNLIV